MISTKLITDLEPHLREAEEIWVAVALMKDKALEKIQSLLPSDTMQHYLIGINLPTTPTVLETLMNTQSEKLNAAMYGNSDTFHPKLYLIKKSTEFIAFIGSANATMGGFFSNIELSFSINDQDKCLELQSWFEKQLQKSKQITIDFLAKYKATYRKNLKWRSAHESNLNSVFNELNNEQLNTLIKEGQFFGQSDFEAYNPVYHLNASEFANNQRKQVRDRLLELHEIIYPGFHEFGITDLHGPPRKLNYTSQYFHSRGVINEKDAIWLNYGKSASQLSNSKDKTFVNNIRIQFILRHNANEKFIGIWLFIGKPNKSREDREYLKLQITDSAYLELLYTLFLELGDSYWIAIKSDQRFMNEFADKAKLLEFLNSDDFRGYYKIGRNYDPNNECLSEDNIGLTVLTDFAKLFKIYEIVRKP